MAESSPPTSEEMRQLSRSLMDKVLDKACSDPTWKQQLLDDPQAAMRAANFPEAQRLEEIRQKEEAAEVRGQQRVVDHYDLSGSSIDAPPSPTCGVGYTRYCYYTWW